MFKKLFKYLFILVPFLIAGFIFFSNSVLAVPASFEKNQVVSGLNFPTGFTFLPDGRMLVIEQGGWVKVLQDNQIQGQPFLTLDVDTNGERGLLGIAVDPQFAQNHYVYVTYVSRDPLELRVSRFTEANGQAVAGTELVLLRSTQTINLIHQAGTLRFGPDGKLWITVGNNELKANSQDLSNIHGKLLRINKDGSIPTDNPFYNQSGKAQAIFAYGLRNPFRFSFLPDGRPILGDVGDDKNEEINIITYGGNYGYPNVEGPCNCQYIDPLFSYPHGDGAAVVGGFSYTGDNFPAEYKNSYFYGDFVNSYIKRIVFDSQGNFVRDEMFDASAGPVVDMQQGPDGRMYYITIYGSSYTEPGGLWTIGYGSDNEAPVAKAGAGPFSGSIPLKVYFWSESTDADGDQLGYTWDFGDGTTSTEANPEHTYATKGIYKAKLTVFDGRLSNTSAEIEIAAGFEKPSLRITSPADGYKYNAGDTISYYGVGWDAEDGNLPASAYSWQVLFHHGEHVHPFISYVTGQSGSFVIPSSGEPSADTWYQIFGTVTDSQGLTKTVSNSIYPNKVTVNFQTDPVGLQFTLDGQPTTDTSFEAIVGYKRTVDVVSPQLKGSESFQFEGWSDGGAKTHTITIPNTNQTYTAKFKSLGSGTSNLRFRVAQLNSESGWQNQYLNDIKVKLTDTNGETVYATSQTATQFGNESGWVFFDNILAGNYGVMAYKSGFEGVWKKVDCTNPNGSFTNASITNQSSERYKAAWNNNVTVLGGQTTWCTDLGLKENSLGSIRFRTLNVVPNQNGYSVSGFINDVNVKLTNTAGDSVVQATTSFKRADGEDGWVEFNNIQAGNYGILGYKAGYTGYLKKISCSIEEPTNATIQNNLTEGQIAAWNNNVAVSAGRVTYCYDLGLRAGDTVNRGNIRLRVAEFSQQNGWLNNYMNGITVKLTDTQGNTTVAQGTTGTQFGNENGWVFLDNVAVGNYGVMAYKSGYEGAWKKLSCDVPGGSFSNMTLKNATSENNVAAWNNAVSVGTGQTTWCTDLGLKQSVSGTGNVRVRVAEFSEQNGWLNNYLNDVTVKLTDVNGATHVGTANSGNQFGSEAGWAFFDNIPAGTYGVMAYKSGYDGVWKKMSCDAASGTFDSASIQNSLSESQKAAWNSNIVITTGQTAWCVDLGLKKKV